jgi:hypothetical protein
LVVKKQRYNNLMFNNFEFSEVESFAKHLDAVCNRNQEIYIDLTTELAQAFYQAGYINYEQSNGLNLTRNGQAWLENFLAEPEKICMPGYEEFESYYAQQIRLGITDGLIRDVSKIRGIQAANDDGSEVVAKNMAYYDQVINKLKLIQARQIFLFV